MSFKRFFCSVFHQWHLAAAGVFVVACAGCGKQDLAPPEDVRPVRTLVVSSGDGEVSAIYSGEIRARYESKLGFKVAGKVAARMVEVGTVVSAGQTLMRLDPHDAALSADSAAAEAEGARLKLTQSRIDLERGQRLFDERFISKAALEQYKLTYETAESQFRSVRLQQRLAQNQRAHTLLVADRAGVVTTLDVEVGQVVSAGQSVLTLAAGGEREVVVSVPESRIDELRNARDMSVTTWANPDHAYAASLRELAPDTDKATRTYAARVTIREPDASIRLGMTANVNISMLNTRNTIRVPLSAIFSKSGESLVWLVDPNSATVSLRAVTIAGTQQDSVTVKSGLREGEVVVTAGVQMLHAGQKVKLMPQQVALGRAQ